MSDILARLRGGLVVSCQPVDGGPMDSPRIVAAMAAASVVGGAAALRIEGEDNLRAARKAVTVPIIGIIKRDFAGSPVRITPSVEDVTALAGGGADIVAVDGTDRQRSTATADLLHAIHGTGCLAMADCATASDGAACKALGFDILGTTLSGYTAETTTDRPDPDFALIRAFRTLGAFTMAEGRFNTPDLAARALAAGADAVTVGTALTRLEVMTGWFAAAVTTIAAARIEAGQIAARARTTTDGKAPGGALVAAMGTLLRELGYARGDPLGIAVSGRIDAQGHWHAVNLDTLREVSAIPLQGLARREIGDCRCLNDAAAAVLAEAGCGAGRGATNLAYVTVSTGIGGGLMVDGKLLSSVSGLSGHIGFAGSRFSDRVCGSGRFGTVESVAGGRSIAEAAALAGHAVDARSVIEAAGAGEPWAAAIIDRSARSVAALIADLCAILGLDRAILGGSIGLSEGYLRHVRSALEGEPALFRVPLVTAELGPDAPLFGALANATGMNVA